MDKVTKLPTSKPPLEQEYLPAESDEILRKLAAGERVVVPRSENFTRNEVVDAFQDAFVMIGGVPALARWAADRPTDFYRLYAKLMPAASKNEVEHSGGFQITHTLPPNKLDE